jgi:hypothetical protein
MPPLPKGAHVHSARSTLRAGLVIGAALSGVAIAWLLVANRVPALDRIAQLRNLAAGALAVILMLVPVYRFRRHPSHLFACTLTAWFVLTAIYAILQIPFPHLGIRMGTFHFFMLGAVVLGLASALVWVIHLVLTVWNEPAVPARKRTP